MNKWFFAYLHLRRKLEDGEVSAPPQDADSKLIHSFIEQCLKPIQTKNVSGKFDRAEKTMEIILEMYDAYIKPKFRGDPEWFPVLLGLESGLWIAKTQLDFIKKKGG